MAGFLAKMNFPRQFYMGGKNVLTALSLTQFCVTDDEDIHKDSSTFWVFLCPWSIILPPKASPTFPFLLFHILSQPCSPPSKPRPGLAFLYIHLPTLLLAVHFTYPSSAPGPHNIQILICKNPNKTTKYQIIAAIIETKKRKELSA